MQRARRIVAAALGGGVLATLGVTALALGAGERSGALVTLQVAARGSGTIIAVPTGSGAPNPCLAHDENNDCRWSYEQGTTVRLTATRDGPGSSFFSWSDPECGTNPVCSVRLDENFTSRVAVFSPLMLAVRFSGGSGGATVTANPLGQPCDEEEPSNSRLCALFAPGTRVTLTLMQGSNPFRGWNEGGDYRCEPTNLPTCTIVVNDHPTWAGARFEGNSAPGLPPTITVDFKLRKAGNGGGRVTASGIDCGTVCTTSYGFGKPITLTANPDDGSLFDGWNGVCARTQLTCSFAAGPITSIRAAFTRDATAPTTPGAPAIGTTTRSSISITWVASRDNVRVAGYRVYVNDAPAGETQAPAYTVQGLKCGRSYAIAVDAVDSLGNRSPRASVTAQTRPCALAARLAGVGVGRAGGKRVVIATVRVNRATTARLRLLRGGRTIVTGRFRVAPGANKLRLRVPKSVARGSYRLAATLVNPDGGTIALPRRGVLLPRP